VRVASPSIRLLVTPHGLSELARKECLTIVIDVLRACTTIAHALHAGARGIIPVRSVEEALRLGATLDRDSTLICGERDSLRIEGFDLGNSPAEYVSNVVDGKTLVLLTTNGSRALEAASSGKSCLAASFVTLRASATRALAHDHVAIACAGSGDSISFEDFLCAGMLIEEILRDRAYCLDDGARLAAETARTHAMQLVTAVRGADHARFLEEIGFGEDVMMACEVDRFSFVPVLSGGRITAETPAVSRAR
jgi:2-phosphosulfolactate phosphatase